MSLSRGQKVNTEIATYIKARNALIWISSTEELRVERALTEISASTGYKIRFWDIATGLTEFDKKGQLVPVPLPAQDIYNQSALTYGNPALDFIKKNTEHCLYVLRDLHKLLADPVLLRGLKSLSKEMQSLPLDQARVMVVLTSESNIPQELKPVPFIDYPLPDRVEVEKILREAINSQYQSLEAQALLFETGSPKEKFLADPLKAERLRNKAKFLLEQSDLNFEAAVDAAVGLTAEEASNCYARSMVVFGKVDPSTILQEKKNIISQEKVLTWHEPEPRGMDAVGGLDLLKSWLELRKLAFSPEAREKNLPVPKGMLVAGISGTGKSLCVKCLGTAWSQPILRLDLGAVQNMYVGESQKNLRKAFKIAEASGKCILWVDELEKALAGASGPSGDGGVAADQVGALLTWMQEKTAPVFVAATANDVRKLPPELMRKGRFDEVFWVDLPNTKEREEILKAALKEHKQVLAEDFSAVIEATNEFIGAEIAALVPEAMFAAFADGQRSISVSDLTRAAAGVIPLSRTAEKTLTELREWARGRAKPASSPETNSVKGIAVGRGEVDMTD